MRRNAASSPRYRFNYWWKEVWTTVGSLDAKNNENHLRGRKLVNIFIFFFQRLIHQLRRNRDSFRTLLMNHNTFNFQSSEIHVSTNSPTTSPPPLFLIPLKIRLREIKGAKFSINFRQRSSKFGEEKKELIRASERQVRWNRANRADRRLNVVVFRGRRFTANPRLWAINPYDCAGLRATRRDNTPRIYPSMRRNVYFWHGGSRQRIVIGGVIRPVSERNALRSNYSG